MVRRIVIHSGFHKTGTTSAQSFLAENGPVLWPVMALGMRYKFPELLSATRGYSTWRDPFALEKVRRRFAAYLTELGLGKRDLLISSEELSGHMPGRADIQDYSAAPTLMAELEDVLKSTFPEAELTFVFTLRGKDTWLRSAYWEHVKSSRMTHEFNAFCELLHNLDLRAAAQDVAERVSSPVRVFWLEEIAALPFGPATPLLDLMKVPKERRARLSQVAPKNRAPGNRTDLTRAFLRLNRSDLGTEDLKQAKADLLNATR